MTISNGFPYSCGEMRHAMLRKNPHSSQLRPAISRAIIIPHRKVYTFSTITLLFNTKGRYKQGNSGGECMAKSAEPTIGAWYKKPEGDKFEVVAIDDKGAVEVQYFDGSIEEIDIDSWNEMEIEPIEPPEDWSGPYDDLESDDLGYTDVISQAEEWGPMETLGYED
jgi:hypothetical protein